MARAKTRRPWTETIRIAPGELALVQAFINTDDGVRKIDELANPTALTGWLIHRELVATDFTADAQDVQRAREVRGALRALVRAHARGRLAEAATARLNRVAHETGVRILFAPDGGTRFEALDDGLAGAFGRIFAAFARSQAAGLLPRFKICDGPKCGRAFFDASPGITGRWCSMKVCGNRVKAGVYRRRHPEEFRPRRQRLAK